MKSRWFSFDIDPDHISLLIGFLECIPCLHWADLSLCWSGNTSTSMHRSLLDNVTYEFVLASPGGTSHVLFVQLEELVKLKPGDYATVVLCGVAPRIRSKQHAAFLCNSYPYLPTPSPGEVITQGQFLSGLNSEFSFS